MGCIDRRLRTAGLSGVLTLLVSVGAFAQGNAPDARVRGLNNALLQLHSQVLSGSTGAATQARIQAVAVISERQAALAALIAEDPQAALELAFSADLVDRLAKAFPQPAGGLEAHGAWIGRYEAYVVDDETLTRAESVQRLRVGTQRLALHFAGPEPEGLKGGDFLRVEGLLAGGAIAAAGGEVQSSAEAGATCSTSGAQRIAIIKVKFPGTTPSYANSTLQDYFFGASGVTLNRYWQEASYGAAWASGDVYPAGSDNWYTLDREYSCSASNDESDLLRDKAIQAADPDVDFQTYERVFILFPNPSSGCRYAGLASIGCWLPAPDGSPSISYALQRIDQMGSRSNAVKLSSHEGGHMLGVHHASSRDFGAEALGPLNAAGTHSEYGDVFSTMGSWNLGHYGAQHKKTLGWLPNFQSVSSNGTFSIQPMSDSPTGALQAIEVKRGTESNTKLWIEFHRPHGSFESTLGSQVFNGALIRYDNLSTGGRTLLLDFTPQTSSWTDPALTAGNIWQDGYSNLSLTVNSATDSALNVSVNYGPVPCVEANPTVTLSPASVTVDAGEPANYTVLVTNNDSSGCSSGVFNLSSSSPANWSTVFGSSSLTIAPGGNASTTMTKTPLSTPAVGTYAVNALAAHATSSGSYSGSGSAQVHVVEPTFSLSLSVSGKGGVTVDPPGSNCRGTCVEEYSQAAAPAVTLTATPDNRQCFAGWGGACSGAGTNLTCNVTMNTDHSVSASFARKCSGGGGGGGGKSSNGKGKP